MLVSLPSSVGRTLQKPSVLAVLHNPGFNMPLRYMAYCSSRGVEGLQ